MTVINHMMTGALIAVAVHRPELAIPLALISHFVADMLPHYGYGDVPFNERDAKKNFLIKQTLDTYTGMGLFWIVPYLLRDYQAPWVTMWCMFSAALPDAYWAIQYAVAQRKGTYTQPNWYARFHKAIQWCERPWGVYVEFVWLIFVAISIKLLVS